MDGSRFDDLTRGLAGGLSRRSLLRGLAGGLMSAAGLAAANTSVEAKKPSCPEDSVTCRGQCIPSSQLTADSANCGACGVRCSACQVCSGGQCVSNGDLCCGVRCRKGSTCIAGQCDATCAPRCQGKQCGDDGCGGSCGTCAANQICANGGKCRAVSTTPAPITTTPEPTTTTSEPTTTTEDPSTTTTEDPSTTTTENPSTTTTQDPGTSTTVGPACKAVGDVCDGSSDCCSNDCNKGLCRCNTNADCPASAEACVANVCDLGNTRTCVPQPYCDNSCPCGKCHSCANGTCVANNDDTPCEGGICCGGSCRTDGQACSGCVGQVCDETKNIFCCAGHVCVENSCALCKPNNGANSISTCAAHAECCSGCCFSGGCADQIYCAQDLCDGVTCTASDQCHDAGTCNPLTGECSNPARTDGAACNDGDLCTRRDTCQAGVCTGGDPVVCTPLDQCHVVGICEPSTGICSNPAKPDHTSCNDGNACTLNDVCLSGVCTGAALTCQALDECHDPGTCEAGTGVCSNPNKTDGASCNDGNGVCLSGACAACLPGAQRPCYTGPEGTAGVGICAMGSETCLADGSGYGSCEGEITPTAEICNNLDDDCDGVIDEGAICPPVPHGLAGCENGECVVTVCDAGYSDCDGVADNGCETELANTVDHCGACGDDCSDVHGSPFCEDGECGIVCNAGYANCDLDARSNGCETNLKSDPNNCGGCGTRCIAANATSTCSEGVCQVEACNFGYGNCNNNAVDGCEINLRSDANNCGFCGNKCSLPNASVVSCVNFQCQVESCNVGFANCDGNPANGCEINLQTDFNNCGACGTRCNLANGTEACVSGVCQVVACDAGWGNCDGNHQNGCETNLMSSTSHCGSCNDRCSSVNGVPSCVGGQCHISCNAGFGNCDGNARSNGCETNLTNHPGHCGACGGDCFSWTGSASVDCSNGNCCTDPGAGWICCPYGQTKPRVCSYQREYRCGIFGSQTCYETIYYSCCI